MTGASLEIRYFENSLDDLICHPKLLAALQENLAETGAEADAPEGTDRYGSSDIGNVSHALPTAFAELACGLPADIPVHSEGFLAAAHGPLADKTMPVAAWAMGMTALDVFRDPSAYLL